MIEKIAILMLACRDYEAMELSLACHMEYGNPEIPLFILQNCRGDYDAERTHQVGKRYETLFPERVRLIDHIEPGHPYKSISEVLNSTIFSEFELICKVDDDAFPLDHGWIESLLSLWDLKSKEHAGNLAYVTPLINNNCWGFAETIKALGLEDVYFGKYARDHYAGSGEDRRLYSRSEIATGANGTIWQLSYLARWIHDETTLKPDRFIAATKTLTPVEVPSGERYSIGCILFRKELWSRIDAGGSDDEHMMHQYCKKNGLKIFCQRSVPFSHMAYFVQREENRDIVAAARELYQDRLGLPYPIALHKSRELEIEARLRWLETGSVAGGGPNSRRRARSARQSGARAFKNILRAIRRRLGLP